MNGLSRETRLQIMLDDNELAAIDDWRFQRRMPSRAAAIRELLRRGLQADLGAATDRSKRSGEFGVIGNDEEPAA
jgi:metal-responsive CopG/Arc/MetJ family transcriptional regulator